MTFTPAPKPAPKAPKPKKRLARSSKLARVSEKRKAAEPKLAIRGSTIKPKRTVKRFAHLRDPEYRAWIRTMPCLVRSSRTESGVLSACAGRIECAHVRTRAVGGADVANTVPLCTRHHREQHRIGIRSFERLYGFCLESRALYYGAIQPGHIGEKRLWMIRDGAA